MHRGVVHTFVITLISIYHVVKSITALFLRWDPPIHSQGLEEGEEAKANGGVFPAGRLLFRNRPQSAEVPRVPGGPQQERRGAGPFSRLLSLLLF